ncbi:MAG TPA: hypothetical protein VFJ02_19600 [Vicinamibacterales bacterium]|nr:hypothetical protein [Vicinamibacterales bacterium]
MRYQTIVPAVLAMLVAGLPALAQKPKGAPEMFTASLQVTGAKTGAAAATIHVEVQQYSTDADRTAVESALKAGGYPAFLTALRKAPEVGTVSTGSQKWTIRYARERKTDQGRSIVVVTDKPIYFVGGGSVDAKPRAGYEVAVIQIDVDDVGLGTGSMAAAARVKPDGEGGVRIDDYAEQPIKLVSVVRKF